MAAEDVRNGLWAERIETLIGAARDESHRDAESIRSELAQLQRRDTTFAEQLEALNQRAHRLEESVRQLRVEASDVSETALGAMRNAELSIHEVNDVGHGLMRHLETVDETRRAESAAAEKKRVDASAAHSKKIASIESSQQQQVKAVDALASTVAGGVKTRFSPALIVLVTAGFATLVPLANCAGDVAKTWILHQAGVPPPPTFGPDAGVPSP